MALRLRLHQLPRLLAVTVGLAGLLAMHGLGPSHAGMAGAQMASAPMSDSVMAGPLSDGAGATSAAVSSVSAARAATAAGVSGQPGMPSLCVAVLGASLLLLALARLRAAAQLGPHGRVAPSALHVGGRPRPPSSLSAPSAAQLCVWRT